MEKYVANAFKGKQIVTSMTDKHYSKKIENFIKDNEAKNTKVIIDFFNNGKLERQVYKTK